MAYSTSIEDLNKILALETNNNLLIKHNKDLMNQIQLLKEKLKESELRSEKERVEREKLIKEFDKDLYKQQRKEILENQIIEEKTKAYTKLKRMYEQLHSDYNTVMVKYLQLNEVNNEKR